MNTAIETQPRHEIAVLSIGPHYVQARDEDGELYDCQSGFVIGAVVDGKFAFEYQEVFTTWEARSVEFNLRASTERIQCTDRHLVRIGPI